MMERVSAFLNRKVLGVKVLYLLAVAVIALAIVAFVMKPKADPADEVSDTDVTPDDGTDGGVDYAGDGSEPQSWPATGSGTVTVMPPQADLIGNMNESILSNEEWLSRSVAYLVSKGVSGTIAQSALTTYLAGGQLSITQKNNVDDAIKEFGLPPQGVDSVSATPNRRLVRYVKTPVASTIYAQYSDNTLHAVRNAEYAALGRPKVVTVPVSDTVWTYPTYSVSGALAPVAENPMNIVGWYVDPAGTYYARRQSGQVVKVARSTWERYGKPAATRVSKGDARLKGA